MFIRLQGKTDVALVNMDRVVSVMEPSEDDGEDVGCILVMEDSVSTKAGFLTARETVDEVEQLVETAHRRCCTPFTRNEMDYEKGEVVRVDVKHDDGRGVADDAEGL